MLYPKFKIVALTISAFATIGFTSLPLAQATENGNVESDYQLSATVPIESPYSISSQVLELGEVQVFERAEALDLQLSPLFVTTEESDLSLSKVLEPYPVVLQLASLFTDGVATGNGTKINLTISPSLLYLRLNHTW